MFLCSVGSVEAAAAGHRKDSADVEDVRHNLEEEKERIRQVSPFYKKVLYVLASDATENHLKNFVITA